MIYRCAGEENYLKSHHRDKDIFEVDSDILVFTKRLYILPLTLPPPAALIPIKTHFLRPAFFSQRAQTWDVVTIRMPVCLSENFNVANQSMGFSEIQYYLC